MKEYVYKDIGAQFQNPGLSTPKKWKMKSSIGMYMDTAMYVHKCAKEHYPFVICHWLRIPSQASRASGALQTALALQSRSLLPFSHSTRMLSYKLSPEVGTTQIKATEMQFKKKNCRRILAGLLHFHCRFDGSFKNITLSSPSLCTQLCIL